MKYNRKIYKQYDQMKDSDTQPSFGQSRLYQGPRLLVTLITELGKCSQQKQRPLKPGWFWQWNLIAHSWGFCGSTVMDNKPNYKCVTGYFNCEPIVMDRYYLWVGVKDICDDRRLMERQQFRSICVSSKFHYSALYQICLHCFFCYWLTVTGTFWLPFWVSDTFSPWKLHTFHSLAVLV